MTRRLRDGRRSLQFSLQPLPSSVSPAERRRETCAAPELRAVARAHAVQLHDELPVPGAARGAGARLRQVHARVQGESRARPPRGRRQPAEGPRRALRGAAARGPARDADAVDGRAPERDRRREDAVPRTQPAEHPRRPRGDRQGLRGAGRRAAGAGRSVPEGVGGPASRGRAREGRGAVARGHEGRRDHVVPEGHAVRRPQDPADGRRVPAREQSRGVQDAVPGFSRAAGRDRFPAAAVDASFARPGGVGERLVLRLAADRRLQHVEPQGCLPRRHGARARARPRRASREDARHGRDAEDRLGRLVRHASAGGRDRPALRPRPHDVRRSRDEQAPRGPALPRRADRALLLEPRAGTGLPRGTRQPAAGRDPGRPEARSRGLSGLSSRRRCRRLEACQVLAPERDRGAARDRRASRRLPSHRRDDRRRHEPPAVVRAPDPRAAGTALPLHARHQRGRQAQPHHPARRRRVRAVSEHRREPRDGAGRAARVALRPEPAASPLRAARRGRRAAARVPVPRRHAPPLGRDPGIRARVPLLLVCGQRRRAYRHGIAGMGTGADGSPGGGLPGLRRPDVDRRRRRAGHAAARELRLPRRHGVAHRLHGRAAARERELRAVPAHVVPPERLGVRVCAAARGRDAGRVPRSVARAPAARGRRALPGGVRVPPEQRPVRHVRGVLGQSPPAVLRRPAGRGRERRISGWRSPRSRPRSGSGTRRGRCPTRTSCRR